MVRRGSRKALTGAPGKNAVCISYTSLQSSGQISKLAMILKSRGATSKVMSDAAAMALMLVCVVLTAMMKHWL